MVPKWWHPRSICLLWGGWCALPGLGPFHFSHIADYIWLYLNFVFSLTQMLVFLFLYVILSILIFILVCAAASLFGQCQMLQEVQIMEEALMIPPAPKPNLQTSRNPLAHNTWSNIFFVHAITGFDTIHAPYNIGKQIICLFWKTTLDERERVLDYDKGNPTEGCQSQWGSQLNPVKVACRPGGNATAAKRYIQLCDHYRVTGELIKLLKLFHFMFVLTLNWARNSKTAMRLKVFLCYIIIMQI